MKTKQKTRWMATFSTESDQRPAWLPRDAVLIRLSGGPQIPAPAAEPGPVSADELNAWPSTAPPTAKVPPPDFAAAIAARKNAV